MASYGGPIKKEKSKKKKVRLKPTSSIKKMKY